MTNWHGYFAVEDLNLNAAQRATLIAELRSLGPASDPQPARLNHWRTRLSIGKFNRMERNRAIALMIKEG